MYYVFCLALLSDLPFSCVVFFSLARACDRSGIATHTHTHTNTHKRRRENTPITAGEWKLFNNSWQFRPPPHRQLRDTERIKISAHQPDTQPNPATGSSFARHTHTHTAFGGSISNLFQFEPAHILAGWLLDVAGLRIGGWDWGLKIHTPLLLGRQAVRLTQPSYIQAHSPHHGLDAGELYLHTYTFTVGQGKEIVESYFGRILSSLD